MSKINLSLLFILISFGVIAQEGIEKNYDTFKEFLDEQNSKLVQIENGYSQETVTKIMGESIFVKVPKVGKMKPLNKLFEQPIATNKFYGNPSKKIDISWYFSTPQDQNGLISKKECTPVVFENNKVVGIGWDFFNKYRRTTPLK